MLLLVAVFSGIVFCEVTNVEAAPNAGGQVHSGQGTSSNVRNFLNEAQFGVDLFGLTGSHFATGLGIGVSGTKAINNPTWKNLGNFDDSILGSIFPELNIITGGPLDPTNPKNLHPLQASLIGALPGSSGVSSRLNNASPKLPSWSEVAP